MRLRAKTCYFWPVYLSTLPMKRFLSLGLLSVLVLSACGTPAEESAMVELSSEPVELTFLSGDHSYVFHYSDDMMTLLDDETVNPHFAVQGGAELMVSTEALDGAAFVSKESTVESWNGNEVFLYEGETAAGCPAEYATLVYDKEALTAELSLCASTNKNKGREALKALFEGLTLTGGQAGVYSL